MRGGLTLIIVLLAISPLFAIEPFCDACYKANIELSPDMENTILTAKVKFNNITYFYDVNGQLMPVAPGMEDWPKDAAGNPVPLGVERITLEVDEVQNPDVYFEFEDYKASDDDAVVLCDPSLGDEHGVATCSFRTLRPNVPNPAGIDFVNLRKCIYAQARFPGKQEDGYFIKPASKGVILCPAENSAISGLSISIENAVRNNIGFCIPMLIIGGMLVAGMYYSGKNPLSLFDITVPRLPHVKALRIGRTNLPWQMSAKGAMNDRLIAMTGKVQAAAFGKFSKRDRVRGALLKSEIQGILKRKISEDDKMKLISAAITRYGFNINDRWVGEAFGALMQSEQMKMQFKRDEKAVEEGEISWHGKIFSKGKLNYKGKKYPNPIGWTLNRLNDLEKPLQRVPFFGSSLIGRSQQALVRLAGARQGNVAVRRALLKQTAAEALRATGAGKGSGKLAAFVNRNSADKVRMGSLPDVLGRVANEMALTADLAHRQTLAKLHELIEGGIDRKLAEKELELKRLIASAGLKAAGVARLEKEIDEIKRLKDKLAERVAAASRGAKGMADANDRTKTMMDDMVRFAVDNKIDVVMGGEKIVSGGKANRGEIAKILGRIERITDLVTKDGYVEFNAKTGEFQLKKGAVFDPDTLLGASKNARGVREGGAYGNMLDELKGARFLEFSQLLREGRSVADIYAVKIAGEKGVKIDRWEDLFGNARDPASRARLENGKLRMDLLGEVADAMERRIRQEVKFAYLLTGPDKSLTGKQLLENAGRNADGLFGNIQLNKTTDFGLRHALSSQVKLGWSGVEDAFGRQVQMLLRSFDFFYGKSFESLMSGYNRTAERNMLTFALIEENAKRLGHGSERLDAKSYKDLIDKGITYGDLRKGMWLSSIDGTYTPFSKDRMGEYLISQYSEKMINSYVLIRDKSGKYVHGDPQKDQRVASAIREADLAIDPAKKIAIGEKLLGITRDKDGKAVAGKGLLDVTSIDEYMKKDAGMIKRMSFGLSSFGERVQVGGLDKINRGLMDWYSAQLQTRLALSKLDNFINNAPGAGDRFDIMSEKYRNLKDVEGELLSARSMEKKARMAGEAAAAAIAHGNVDRLMSDRKDLMANVSHNELDRSLLAVRGQMLNFYNITESSVMRDPRIAIGAGYGIQYGPMVGYQTGQFVYERPSMIFGPGLLPGDATANWLMRPTYWTAVMFSQIARPFYTSIIGYPSVYDNDMFYGASMRKGNIRRAVGEALSITQNLEIFHRFTLPRIRKKEEYFTEEGFRITGEGWYGKRFLAPITFRRDVEGVGTAENEERRLQLLGIQSEAGQDVKRRMLGSHGLQRTEMRMEIERAQAEMDRYARGNADLRTTRDELIRVLAAERSTLTADQIKDLNDAIARRSKELHDNEAAIRRETSARKEAEQYAERPLEKMPGVFGRLFQPGYYNILNLGGYDIALEGSRMRGFDLYAPYHKSGIWKPPVPGMLDITPSVPGVSESEWRMFPRVAAHVMANSTLAELTRFKTYGLGANGDVEAKGDWYRSPEMESNRDVYRHEDSPILRLAKLESERMGYSFLNSPFSIPLSPLAGAIWFGAVRKTSFIRNQASAHGTAGAWSGTIPTDMDPGGVALAARQDAVDPRVAAGAQILPHEPGTMGSHAIRSMNDRINGIVQADYYRAREMCPVHRTYSAFGSECPQCSHAKAKPLTGDETKYRNWLDTYMRQAEETGRIREQMRRDERVAERYRKMAESAY
jgi:hypothetical protein